MVPASRRPDHDTLRDAIRAITTTSHEAEVAPRKRRREEECAVTSARHATAVAGRPVPGLRSTRGRPPKTWQQRCHGPAHGWRRQLPALAPLTW